MQASILHLISVYASLYNVDPVLVQSIIHVESRGNPSIVGKAGEIGLMQIMPKYSRFTPEELKEPAINILEGIRIIKQAKKRCKYKENKQWLVCYNVGVNGAEKVKHPSKWKYYNLVMEEYYKRKAQL